LGTLLELLGYIEDDIFPLMEGSLSAGDFWKNLSGNSGLSIDREFWGELFKPVIDEETRKIISELKTAYRVVCGTNTIAEHFDIHENRGDYDIFNEVYASHLMGIAKPKPDFFRWILEKEGVLPEETIFTDDLAENIDAARALGINSFLFKDALTFESELKEADFMLI